MIKKGEHLTGVEPINEKKIDNKNFLNLLKRKYLIDEKNYLYIKEILNGRDVLDKSGYSGSSTILVNKSETNEDEYVIKIQKVNNHLEDEFIMYNYFYKKGLSSKPIKFIRSGEYEYMIVSKINLVTAGNYFNNYQEISLFFGKELRKFHDYNLINDKFNKEELNILKNKYLNNFEEALNTETGLIYLSIYMNDYDYNNMKKSLKNNKWMLFDDPVLLHGDFNPNNVFISEDNIKLIDFKDTGFGDRHYDIFWTMFMIIIFSGILKEKEKIEECEKIFLDAYGKDLINTDKLEFFKRFACMYWKQHDEITRVDDE